MPWVSSAKMTDEVYGDEMHGDERYMVMRERTHTKDHADDVYRTTDA